MEGTWVPLLLHFYRALFCMITPYLSKKKEAIENKGWCLMNLDDLWKEVRGRLINEDEVNK